MERLPRSLGPALLRVVVAGTTLAGGCQAAAPTPDSAVGRPIAEAFLAQLRAGRVDAAWQGTTAEFKSYEGRESFARYVRQHPVLRRPLAFVEYQTGEINGLLRGQYVYQPAAPDLKSAASRVRVAVALEGEVWKVEGVFVE